jgi:hypothetical protein
MEAKSRLLAKAWLKNPHNRSTTQLTHGTQARIDYRSVLAEVLTKFLVIET